MDVLEREHSSLVHSRAILCKLECLEFVLRGRTADCYQHLIISNVYNSEDKEKKGDCIKIELSTERSSILNGSIAMV